VGAWPPSARLPTRPPEAAISRGAAGGCAVGYPPRECLSVPCRRHPAPCIQKRPSGEPSVLTRDAQDFLDGRLPAQDPRPAVIADRRCGLARVAFELLLAGPIMDHGAHGVIDQDELIDAR